MRQLSLNSERLLKALIKYADGPPLAPAPQGQPGWEKRIRELPKVPRKPAEENAAARAAGGQYYKHTTPIDRQLLKWLGPDQARAAAQEAAEWGANEVKTRSHGGITVTNPQDIPLWMEEQAVPKLNTPRGQELQQQFDLGYSDNPIDRLSNKWLVRAGLTHPELKGTWLGDISNVLRGPAQSAHGAELAQTLWGTQNLADKAARIKNIIQKAPGLSGGHIAQELTAIAPDAAYAKPVQAITTSMAAPEIAPTTRMYRYANPGQEMSLVSDAAEYAPEAEGLGRWAARVGGNAFRAIPGGKSVANAAGKAAPFVGKYLGPAATAILSGVDAYKMLHDKDSYLNEFAANRPSGQQGGMTHQFLENSTKPLGAPMQALKETGRFALTEKGRQQVSDAASAWTPGGRDFKSGKPANTPTPFYYDQAMALQRYNRGVATPEDYQNTAVQTREGPVARQNRERAAQESQESNIDAPESFQPQVNAPPTTPPIDVGRMLQESQNRQDSETVGNVAPPAQPLAPNGRHPRVARPVRVINSGPPEDTRRFADSDVAHGIRQYANLWNK